MKVALETRVSPPAPLQATPIRRLGVASILLRRRAPHQESLLAQASFPYSRAAFSGRRQLHAIMRFKGTKDYVATDDLKVAVNAAITLQTASAGKGRTGDR